ncbi:hypothetical protein AcW1_005917 [Taiwanofungus camphoratus]|nr:hypothetical protein AcV5_006233 [Antrodia cinnamomea]KAI0957569.1 hypothetical protein AcW1_005917 [Antrodia cinnamomea]
MSSPETLTQKWLRQSTQVYANRDTVFADVDAVLARHPAIRPKTDIYTYDDGRTQLLLCLHGLLPITFRAVSYNIPIALWLTREYPRQPPIAYVVPTSDMLVKPGPDMDVSGRCHIGYLRNWEKKSEACSLTALIEAMQDAFSREPPVYAKPKRVSSPHSASMRSQMTGPDYSGRPPPSLPGTYAHTPPHAPSPSVSSVNSHERPPLPAKPSSSAVSPVPYSRTASILPSDSRSNSRSQSPIVLSDSPLGRRPPPPLPPPLVETGILQHGSLSIPPTYSPRAASTPLENPPNFATPLGWAPGAPMAPGAVLHQQQLTHVSQDTMSAVHPLASSPRPPLPPAPGSISPSSPVGAPHGTFYLPNVPAGTVPVNEPPRPAAPPFISPQPTANIQPHHHYVHPPAPPPPPVIPQIFTPPLPVPAPAHSTPPPDLLDADDLTAVQSSTSPPPTASAPPRPPNPELLRLHTQVHAKLQSELASLSHAMVIDAERLLAHQTDLLAGEPAIRDEMARLEAVRDVCHSVAERMRTVVDAAEQNVAELRRKGDPEVDELVCSTTIVHNQLINLVAEDNAIEDTIYHLHRALNTGRIDLERFLRVRHSPFSYF